MQVIKRNGSKVDFDSNKILEALVNAASEVYVVDNDLRSKLANLTTQIALNLRELDIDLVTISMVQSQVEQKLLSSGYIQIAERYIAYRLQRDLERYGYEDKLSVRLHFDRLA